MAIDYQQILVDMNRPHRRQGNAMKKLMVVVCVLLVVGGGGYALWETGLASRAWNGATSLVATVFGREVAPATDAVASVVAAQEQPQTRPASLRPPSVSAAVAIPVPESTRPAPAADGVLRLAVADVAATPQPAASPANEPVAPAAAVVAPAAPVAGAAPAAPVRTASSAEVQAHMQAQAMQRSQQVIQTQPEPVQRAVTTPDLNPTPVLSDAKAQLRVVDQMLSSDPAEALRRVEDVLSMPMLQPDDAAEAGYRKG
ncbi:MAG: hypothetical protein LUC93_15920 [Planctomycetaceae bacterium]|nr:hypothetical protein [Planctomycetaceae bacterium]